MDLIMPAQEKTLINQIYLADIAVERVFIRYLCRVISPALKDCLQALRRRGQAAKNSLSFLKFFIISILERLDEGRCF
jgi:hypothetical protein